MSQFDLQVTEFYRLKASLSHSSPSQTELCLRLEPFDYSRKNVYYYSYTARYSPEDFPNKLEFIFGSVEELFKYLDFHRSKSLKISEEVIQQNEAKELIIEDSAKVSLPLSITMEITPTRSMTYDLEGTISFASRELQLEGQLRNRNNQIEVAKQKIMELENALEEAGEKNKKYEDIIGELKLQIQHLKVRLQERNSAELTDIEPQSRKKVHLNNELQGSSVSIPKQHSNLSSPIVDSEGKDPKGSEGSKELIQKLMENHQQQERPWHEIDYLDENFHSIQGSQEPELQAAVDKTKEKELNINPTVDKQEEDNEDENEKLDPKQESQKTDKKRSLEDREVQQACQKFQYDANSSLSEPQFRMFIDFCVRHCHDIMVTGTPEKLTQKQGCKCIICEKFFRQEDFLVKHMTFKHPNQFNNSTKKEFLMDLFRANEKKKRKSEKIGNVIDNLTRNWDSSLN